MNTASKSEELSRKLERLNQEFIDEGMPIKYRAMECFNVCMVASRMGYVVTDYLTQYSRGYSLSIGRRCVMGR